MNNLIARKKFKAFMSRLPAAYRAGVGAEPDEEGWEDYGFFIYGTLMQGHYNHWLMKGLELAGHVRFQGKAFAKGSLLLDMDGLPAMYNTMHGRYTVRGEQWEISHVARAVLDQFEGDGHFYNRTLIGNYRDYSKAGRKLERKLALNSYTYIGPFVDWGKVEDVKCYTDKDFTSTYQLASRSMRDTLGETVEGVINATTLSIKRVKRAGDPRQVRMEEEMDRIRHRMRQRVMGDMLWEDPQAEPNVDIFADEGEG